MTEIYNCYHKPQNDLASIGTPVISAQKNTVSFYRRPLPESCTSFASTEGKALFREALQNGGMECYFNLAEQYRTQDDPAFCGLSTLTMVINALGIDPGRVWKGPWRWYSEELLDCCVSIEEIKKDERGITLEEMVCLAKCNACEVEVVLAQDTTLEEFRNVLREISKQSSSFLVCAYNRKDLGQTGDGHYSPIGGFHEEKDMCLIFDVARFKYPPHWVKVSLLWEAMMTVKHDKTRGYLLISRSSLASSVFFHVYKRPNMKENILQFLHTIQVKQQECVEVLKLCPSSDNVLASDWVNWFLNCLPCSGTATMMGTYLEQCATVELDSKHRELVFRMLSELEKTEIYRLVEESLRSSYCCQESVLGDIPLLGIVKPAHMMSMLLLIIPYIHWKVLGNAGKNLIKLLDPTDLPELLKNEVISVRRQLTLICENESNL